MNGYSEEEKKLSDKYSWNDNEDNSTLGEEDDYTESDDDLFFDDEEDDEDPEEEYYNYILEKMPFKTFIKLYKVKRVEMTEKELEEFTAMFGPGPYTFEEDDYNLMVGDLIQRAEYSDKSPFDIDYGDFVEWLDDNDCETGLDEDEYQKAREKTKKLGIVSAEEFQNIKYGR